MAASSIRNQRLEGLCPIYAQQSIELPPEVAKAFVEDMRAFFAAGHNTIKADEIAARQLHALRTYQGRREKPIKLTDVKEMFLQTREHL